MDGKAAVQHTYIHAAGTPQEKTYSLEAKVWGLKAGNPMRKAGYLSVKQERADLNSPPNYAINHCELKDGREACALELVTVLNGAGFHVNCNVATED